MTTAIGRIAAGQRGFGTIMAVMVLVILAALAGAIVRLSATEQAVSAMDVLYARAGGAVRAGNDWGLYHALQPGGIWYWDPATYLPAPAPCDAAASGSKSATLDLTADSGFWVTVTCSSQTVNEGETAPGTALRMTIYRIDAVACNLTDAATGCPNGAKAAQPGYIERRRQVVATAAAN